MKKKIPQKKEALKKKKVDARQRAAFGNFA